MHMGTVATCRVSESDHAESVCELTRINLPSVFRPRVTRGKTRHIHMFDMWIDRVLVSVCTAISAIPLVVPSSRFLYRGGKLQRAVVVIQLCVVMDRGDSTVPVVPRGRMPMRQCQVWRQPITLEPLCMKCQVHQIGHHEWRRLKAIRTEPSQRRRVLSSVGVRPLL